MLITVKRQTDKFRRPVYIYVDTDEMTDEQYSEFLENEDAIKQHNRMTGGKYNDDLMRKRRKLLGIN